MKPQNALRLTQTITICTIEKANIYTMATGSANTNHRK